MKVALLEQATKDLHKMDNAVIMLFNRHFDSISKDPYQRHIKHGLDYYVENVGQGRIIYTVEEDAIYIVRCFKSHKDYEKWYRSYR